MRLQSKLDEEYSISVPTVIIKERYDIPTVQKMKNPETSITNFDRLHKIQDRHITIASLIKIYIAIKSEQL
jgi:hypothetical protein